MRLWGMRRKAGFTTLTFHNRGRAKLKLWLEPWAEEVAIPTGSRVDLEVIGLSGDEPEAPLEVTDEHLVFYGPAGTRLRVLVDGSPVETGSATLTVPAARGLGTRGMVHLAFDDCPEARPGGLSAEQTALAALGAAMAEGDVRLEALAEEHRAALKAACAEDPNIWRIYATSYDPEHFDSSFDALLSRASWRCFAIFSEGELVGMSCYIGVDPKRGVLEIGNTYYVPTMRGTGFNERVKKLMLERAFGCGFRRVEFRVDARNARSQAAMAKIGGVREGVIRAERITWTGHVRDTVLFSILRDEWEASAVPRSGPFG